MYPKPTWLGRELPARLARWSVASGSSGFKSTLSLLPILKYSHTYQELKDKYKHMVQVMLGQGPPAQVGPLPRGRHCRGARLTLRSCA